MAPPLPEAFRCPCSDRLNIQAGSLFTPTGSHHRPKLEDDVLVTFALLLKREQLSSDWLTDVSRLLHRRVKLFTFIFALSDFCEFGPIVKTSPRKPLPIRRSRVR